MAFRPSFIPQATLYKFRYIVGYGLLFAVLLIVMTVDIKSLPSGISLQGMDTVVTSMQLDFRGSFDWLINAPYHLLQRASVELLGLERLAVVAPSLIFGFITIIVFFLTMRHWFRESVAVITTLVAVTTGPFITMVRGGTPDIMLPFWTIILLYAAVKVLVKRERAFVWKCIVVLSAIGLLYTPFGIYTLLAFIGGGIFHPHVRSRIRHIKLHRKIILATLGAIGLIPLTIYLIWHPATVATLTGFDLFRASIADFPAALNVFYVSFINFTNNGFIGTNIVPAFNIASICLMVLGFLRSLKDRHTTRSYVILTWLGVALPVVLLAPTAQQVILLPALLLLAIGSETLILDWYKLFPRNPYARIAGLIPLTVLFVTIAVTNVTHYFYNHQYIANPIYRNSLTSIRQTLADHSDQPITLVTDTPTVQFYSLLKRNYSKLSVTDVVPTKISDTTMVTPEISASLGTPSRILTSARSENSVTLRVYQP